MCIVVQLDVGSEIMNREVLVLCEVYIPGGKKSTLSAEILWSLQQELILPEGFASYKEIRVWLEHN